MESTAIQVEDSKTIEETPTVDASGASEEKCDVQDPPTESLMPDTDEAPSKELLPLSEPTPESHSPELTQASSSDGQLKREPNESPEAAEDNQGQMTVNNIDDPIAPKSDENGLQEDNEQNAEPCTSSILKSLIPEFDSDDEGDEIVPPHVFWHVDNCICSGFTEGMQVELEYQEGKYWVGLVVFGIGRMLALNWEGGSPMFWIDLAHRSIHPLGYLRNVPGKTIGIPKEVTDKQHAADFRVLYLDEAIVDNVPVPSALFEFQGKMPCEIFTEGSLVEVSHKDDPAAHWFAKVHNNIGGRLKLKWIEFHADFKESLDSSLSIMRPESFFYLYFCHPRISPLGFAHRDEHKNEYFYKQPDHVGDPDPELLERCLDEARSSATVFRNNLIEQCQEERPCLLREGYATKITETDRVLVIAPDSVQLLPASITKITPVGDMRITSDVPARDGVIDFYYEYDDRMAILPMSWADEHDINVDLPELKGLEFDVKRYVEKKSARSAAIRLRKDALFDEFEINSKIEVVHPSDPTKICEGVVIRRTNPLIWIEISPELIVVLPFNSTDLFPCGWCSNHGHELTKLIPERKCILEELPEVTEEDVRHSETVLSRLPHYATANNAWCPRIYFNHKCFTGPGISKGKICELPQYVGPGPVMLVMQEVISKIFSVAYVPNRCLNELSSKNFVNALKRKGIKDVQLVIFKAKYQKRSYREQIPVVTATDQIDDYCKQVCNQLKACSNLFGVRRYDGELCPANCRGLTKTKGSFKRSSRMRDPGRLSQLLAGKKRNINPNRPANNAKRARSPSPANGMDDENGDSKSLSSGSGKNMAACDDNGSSSNGSSQCPTPDGYADTMSDPLSSMELDPLEMVRRKLAAMVRGAAAASGYGGTNTPPSRKKPKPNTYTNYSSTNGSGRQESRNGASLYSKVREGGSLLVGQEEQMMRRLKAVADHAPSKEELERDPYRRVYRQIVNWNVDQLHSFILTTEFAVFARVLRDQEVDGFSFALLDFDLLKHTLWSSFASLKYTITDLVKLSKLTAQIRATTGLRLN